MYLALFLYFLLGCLFLFFPKQIPKDNYKINIEQIVKYDCSNHNIKCIDSCDFLCTDDKYKCVNNICQPDGKPQIPCDKTKGGIVILTHFQDVPFWNCVCTHNSFYGGKDCSVLASDVCKDGIFIYQNMKRFKCICKNPDILLTLNNKPYCVSKQIQKFFVI